MLRGTDLFSTPIQDLWFELDIPRKNYALGDEINFQVTVHHTGGRQIEFLSINLFQTILEIRTKKRLKKAVNFVHNRIVSKYTAAGFAGPIWIDSLKIPDLISPSLAAGTAVLNDYEPVQAAEIQYFLKVFTKYPNNISTRLIYAYALINSSNEEL